MKKAMEFKNVFIQTKIAIEWKKKKKKKWKYK